MARATRPLPTTGARALLVAQEAAERQGRGAARADEGDPGNAGGHPLPHARDPARRHLPYRRRADAAAAAPAHHPVLGPRRRCALGRLPGRPRL
eukprot:1602265-Prymnesium_polylepis.1